MTDKDYMNSVALLSVLNSLMDYCEAKTALNLKKIYLIIRKDINNFKNYKLLGFNIDEVDNKKLVNMALKRLQTIENNSLSDIISWLIIILKSKYVYDILEREGELKR